MTSPSASNRRVVTAQWATLALLVLMAASLGPAARAEPLVSSFAPSACPVAFPADVTVECGSVLVPESHTSFDGTVVRLAVAIARSPNPTKAPDPVFYLPSSPDASLLVSAPVLVEILAPVLADRDIVFFEQRGTGYAQPSLVCPPTTPPRTGVSLRTLQATDRTPELHQQYELWVSCLQAYRASGVGLPYYNSAEIAADLDDVRRALGLGQINLFGASFGTRLALEALRFRPDTIRAAVLDSVLPPQSQAPVDAFEDFDGALTRLFAACAADAACNAAFPNLAADYDTYLARLNAEPAVIPIYDLDTGAVRDYLPVSGNFVAFVNFQLFYVTPLIPLLPAYIASTADGDYRMLSMVLSLLLGDPPSDQPAVAIGTFAAIFCNEEYPFATATEFVAARNRYRRAAPLAGDIVFNETALDACHAADVGGADPIENEAVVSSVPTLIVSGEFDPITPPENVADVTPTLANSVVVSYPRGGHVPSLASACTMQALVAFYTRPGQTPDTSCIAAEAPLPFMLPDSAEHAAQHLRQYRTLLQQPLR